MKKVTNRIISLILSVIISIQLLPLTSMAALIDNTPEYNQEILDALVDIVGSEDEAALYYELLDRYGLLDEDGNMMESWEIWMDGKQVSLDDIIAVLEEPDCDYNKFVLVDGMAVTLGNIKTMIEIEEYIAYLRNKYYSGGEWTDAHKASLQSLIEQIENEGIIMSDAIPEDFVFPSGINHNARVIVKELPYVTAHGDNTTDKFQSPEKMFDGLTTTKWYSTKGKGNEFKQEFPLWVQIELENVVTVGSYGFVTGDDRPERDPSAWVLYGSNDGEEWEIIDQQSDIILTEERCTEQTFALEQSASFSYFRLEIIERQGGTEENDHGYGVQISEMNFYDEDGSLINLESTACRATLVDAYPGQKASFTWKAHSGSAEVSGSGTVNLVADEDGTATVDFNNITISDVSETVRSTARLTYFIVLRDLTGALFENGYANTTLTAYTAPTIDIEFMDAVARTMENGCIYSHHPDYVEISPYEHNVNITIPFNDTYDPETNPTGDLVSTALDWGLFDWFSIKTVWQTYDYIFTPPETPPFLTIPYLTYKVYANESEEPVLHIEETSVGSSNDDDEYFEAYAYSNIVRKDAVNAKTLFGGVENKTARVEGTIDITHEVMWVDWERSDDFTLKPISNQHPTARGPEFDLNLVVTNEPWIDKVEVPGGNSTFYPGHKVPVVAKFSRPVKPDVTFTMNGTTYKSLESEDANCSYTNRLTFLYEVKPIDDLKLYVQNVSPFEDIAGKVEPDYIAKKKIIELYMNLNTPNRADAITEVVAEMTGDVKNPVLDVSVGIIDEPAMTEWISTAQDEDGKLYIEQLYVSLDGGVTKHNLYFKGENFADGLYASIPLAFMTENYVAELFFEDADKTTLILGKFAAGAHSWELKYITEDDVSAYLGFGDYVHTNEEFPYIYIQSDMPEIKAHINLLAGDYTFDNTSNVAVYGTPEAENADFVWKSSNTAVASVDAAGNVIPTGIDGDVQISLIVRNGGSAEREFEVPVTYKVGETTFDTLYLKAGTTPFLIIPQDKAVTVDGKNVIIYWTSNLIDKNGEEDTSFDIVVSKGSEQVYSVTVSGNVSAPKAFVEIPGEYLSFDYTGGINTYDIIVSSEFDGILYSDTATITIESLPARVGLEKLDSYYILDTVGTVPINWSVEHINRVGDAELDSIFSFEVMRSNEPVEDDVLPVLDNGSASGTFNLPISDINAVPGTPGSYREVYTVTLQAKNGTDSTWSYDSFLLYVYDEDALKIMIDGSNADDTLLMSNVEAISQMTQEQILELKRDIYLKNVISVNYGDYAWTEVADQIVWASDENSVASINYQQGVMYEDIQEFSYTSYRPTTEFALVGHSDGESLVSAVHKLTGMEDTLDVTVETLKDKLYLFKFYPEAVTKLEYKNADGEWQTKYSDANGEAAIYEENGIHGNIHCTSEVDGITYVGMIYNSSLKTGEGDWTMLQRYPLNTFSLRRTGYAYLYIKDGSGNPYEGDIIFRGGVYVNGEYIESALFGLNSTIIDKDGTQDNIVTLDKTGKLSVYMNTKEWNLESGDITSHDMVEYVFQIESKKYSYYYPMLHTVDATLNADTYVGSGSAIITFKENYSDKPHQFIAMQRSAYTGYAMKSDILGTSGRTGPNNNFQESSLTTSVMWWGTELTENEPKLQLTTEDGRLISAEPGQFEIVQNPYVFASYPITNYTTYFNGEVMESLELKAGKAIDMYLDYYSDGEIVSRHELLPFKLTNLIGVGNVQDAESIPEMLANMGRATNTGNKHSMDFGDEFANVAMNLVATDNYNTSGDKMFSIQITPTNDPSKFLGFIEVNVGNLKKEDELISGIFTPSFDSIKEHGTRMKYTPGMSEMMLLAGKKTREDYIGNTEMGMQGKKNIQGKFSGYAESLIYFNENSGKWEIQLLNGGFELAAGLSYSWTWNFFAGPVPVTTQLTIGGTVEVSLDTLGVSYFNIQQDKTNLGTDFLTELRVYLYLRFFAGVGIDFAIVAFKLGIYGQISLDMRFQWLNRPYMDVEDDVYNVADGTYNDSKLYEVFEPFPNENGEYNKVGEYWESPYSKLDGQRFRADGQIGLQLVIRVLFFNFQKVLFSYNFKVFDETTRDWNTIQTNWKKNKEAQLSAISGLLGTGSLAVDNVGGQQVMSLNLAPTIESRDYVAKGSSWNSGDASLFALDENNALQNLQHNSYPYANPVVSEDGILVAYLSDMGSENVEDTRVSYAVRNEYGMYNEGSPIDDGEGYGDTQVSLAGTESFAVAAWARQSESLNKEAGAVITAEDQIVMMASSEVYASVYNGTSWVTTRLTDNQTPDIAPVVAANKDRAVVIWREVAASTENTVEGYTDITNFTERDVILYRVYDGTQWSETVTLYNGTSGAVKGIAAAMLDDGTAAVTYTLDIDNDANTIFDRDVYYAVIDNEEGAVTRNVRATYDAYLDENPQITAVKFPEDDENEYFVLGWFSQQAVANDDAVIMSDGDAQSTNDNLSDIRLMAFDNEGIYAPLLPDSISQAADAENVEITSNFRFVKNADTINDLSILWVQRVGELDENVDNADYIEKDALKGIKFYTFGQNSEIIGFTAAIDVAEMPDGTLIDHFDAYVSDPSSNEVKAVILGTTYGADGVATMTGTTVSGDLVQYAVPSSTTSMYTATEVYSDKIEVSGVLVDYDNVKKGVDTEIMFIVKNNGIHAVSDIEITIRDGKGEDHVSTFTDLNLLPGSSARLYADYAVPVDEVVDVDYIVKPTFNQNAGASGTADSADAAVNGKVYLDIPELQITSAEIFHAMLTDRLIYIKLNNGSDASLAKSGRAVKISFYSDSTCETPIDDFYIDPIMITDPVELAMIDEGGYGITTPGIYHLDMYLWELSNDELEEIPESGIGVYIKAEVLEKSENGEYVPLAELTQSDNYAKVVLESLGDGSENDIKLSYLLTKDNDGCEVAVTAQNTRLSKQVAYGNIVVKLYDADGNMVGRKQLYKNHKDDLTSILPESDVIHKFRFEGEEAKTAVRATVEFAEFMEGEEYVDNLNLSEFSVDELPEISLDSFVLQSDGTYLCDVGYSGLDSINVVASTESVDSKISINGEDTKLAAIYEKITLSEGSESTEVRFTVTSYSGKEATYILSLTPYTEAVSFSVKLAREDGASPYVAEYDDGTTYSSLAKISIMKGDKEVYTLTEDANSDLSEIELEAEIALGTYTLVVTKPGYITYSREIQITAGESDAYAITLIPGDIRGSYETSVGDGIIDIDDFIRIVRGLDPDADVKIKNSVDINEDGTVNVTDLGYVKTNFGKSSADAE